MGEGSKMKNNIANTEKEAKMDKGVKMKKTAKAKAWVKHAGKAKVAAVAGAVVALLFAGSLTALATWSDQGATGYDGGTDGSVAEPAIVFPIDTTVNGRLKDNNGTKQPGDPTSSTIEAANGANQVDFQVFYFGMLSGGMNDAYNFYNEETYGYRTNAAGDTYYAYALTDGNGNPVYIDDNGDRQTIDLSDLDDVANLQSALLKRYHSNKDRADLSDSAAVKYNQLIDGTNTNGAGDGWVYYSYDSDGNTIEYTVDDNGIVSKDGTALDNGVKIELVPFTFKETPVTDPTWGDEYTYLIPCDANGDPLIDTGALEADRNRWPSADEWVYVDIFNADGGLLGDCVKITDYAYNTGYGKQFGDYSSLYNGAYDTEDPFKHGDDMSAYRDSNGDGIKDREVLSDFEQNILSEKDRGVLAKTEMFNLDYDAFSRDAGPRGSISQGTSEYQGYTLKMARYFIDYINKISVSGDADANDFARYFGIYNKDGVPIVGQYGANGYEMIDDYADDPSKVLPLQENATDNITNHTAGAAVVYKNMTRTIVEDSVGNSYISFGANSDIVNSLLGNSPADGWHIFALRENPDQTKNKFTTDPTVRVVILNVVNGKVIASDTIIEGDHGIPQALVYNVLPGTTTFDNLGHNLGTELTGGYQDSFMARKNPDAPREFWKKEVENNNETKTHVDDWYTLVTPNEGRSLPFYTKMEEGVSDQFQIFSPYYPWSNETDLNRYSLSLGSASGTKSAVANPLTLMGFRHPVAPYALKLWDDGNKDVTTIQHHLDKETTLNYNRHVGYDSKGNETSTDPPIESVEGLQFSYEYEVTYTASGSAYYYTNSNPNGTQSTAQASGLTGSKTLSEDEYQKIKPAIEANDFANPGVIAALVNAYDIYGQRRNNTTSWSRWNGAPRINGINVVPIATAYSGTPKYKPADSTSEQFNYTITDYEVEKTGDPRWNTDWAADSKADSDWAFIDIDATPSGAPDHWMDYANYLTHYVSEEPIPGYTTIYSGSIRRDGDTVTYTPDGTPQISGGGGRITGVYVYDLKNPGVIINKALEVEAKLDATKNMWGRLLGLDDPDIMGTDDDGETLKDKYTYYLTVKPDKDPLTGGEYKAGSNYKTLPIPTPKKGATPDYSIYETDEDGNPILQDGKYVINWDFNDKEKNQDIQEKNGGSSSGDLDFGNLYFTVNDLAKTPVDYDDAVKNNATGEIAKARFFEVEVEVQKLNADGAPQATFDEQGNSIPLIEKMSLSEIFDKDDALFADGTKKLADYTNPYFDMTVEAEKTRHVNLRDALEAALDEMQSPTDSNEKPKIASYNITTTGAYWQNTFTYTFREDPVEHPQDVINDREVKKIVVDVFFQFDHGTHRSYYAIASTYGDETVRQRMVMEETGSNYDTDIKEGNTVVHYKGEEVMEEIFYDIGADDIWDFSQDEEIKDKRVDSKILDIAGFEFDNNYITKFKDVMVIKQWLKDAGLEEQRPTPTVHLVPKYQIMETITVPEDAVPEDAVHSVEKDGRTEYYIDVTVKDKDGNPLEVSIPVEKDGNTYKLVRVTEQDEKGNLLYDIVPAVSTEDENVAGVYNRLDPERTFIEIPGARAVEGEALTPKEYTTDENEWIKDIGNSWIQVLHVPEDFVITAWEDAVTGYTGDFTSKTNSITVALDDTRLMVTNELQATPVPLVATKILDGKELKADDFHFDLYERMEDGSQGEHVEIATNDEFGNIIFTPLTFEQTKLYGDVERGRASYEEGPFTAKDAAGNAVSDVEGYWTYAYTVKERIPSDDLKAAGVEYSDESYIVEVVLALNDRGELVTATLEKDANGDVVGLTLAEPDANGQFPYSWTSKHKKDSSVEDKDAKAGQPTTGLEVKLATWEVEVPNEDNTDDEGETASEGDEGNTTDEGDEGDTTGETEVKTETRTQEYYELKGRYFDANTGKELKVEKGGFSPKDSDPNVLADKTITVDEKTYTVYTTSGDNPQEYYVVEDALGSKTYYDTNGTKLTPKEDGFDPADDDIAAKSADVNKTVTATEIIFTNKYNLEYDPGTFTVKKVNAANVGQTLDGATFTLTGKTSADDDADDIVFDQKDYTDEDGTLIGKVTIDENETAGDGEEKTTGKEVVFTTADGGLANIKFTQPGVYTLVETGWTDGNSNADNFLTPNDGESGFDASKNTLAADYTYTFTVEQVENEYRIKWEDKRSLWEKFVGLFIDNTNKKFGLPTMKEYISAADYGKLSESDKKDWNPAPIGGFDPSKEVGEGNTPSFYYREVTGEGNSTLQTATYDEVSNTLTVKNVPKDNTYKFEKVFDGVLDKSIIEADDFKIKIAYKDKYGNDVTRTLTSKDGLPDGWAWGYIKGTDSTANPYTYTLYSDRTTESDGAVTGVPTWTIPYGAEVVITEDNTAITNYTYEGVRITSGTDAVAAAITENGEERTITFTPQAGTGTTAKKYTLTNSYDPQMKANIEVTKEWKDDTGNESLRENVKIHLYKQVTTLVDDGNGNKKEQKSGWIQADVEPLVIAKDATGEALTKAWENLRVYENGFPVKYRIEEEPVPGYAAAYVSTDGFAGQEFTLEATTTVGTGENAKEVKKAKIENKLSTTTDELEITKVWDDNGNADGKRTDVVVTLYEKVWNTTSKSYGDPAPVQVDNPNYVAGGSEPETIDYTLTLATGNDHSENLKDSFTELPTMKNGKPVIYSIGEAQITGYDTPIITPVVEDGAITGYTVTNRYDTGAVTSSPTGSGNLTLFKAIEDESGNGRTPAADEFLFQLEGKAADTNIGGENKSSKDASGIKLLATTAAPDNDGKAKIEFPDIRFSETGTYAFTVKELQGTDATVQTWDTAERTIVATVAVAESGQAKLKVTWSIVPAPAGENLGINDNTITFTNKTVAEAPTPEPGSITILKKWDDEDDADKLRGDVVVKLKAGSADAKNADVEDIGEITLTESANYTATINNLPVTANGEKILYSVEELSVKGVAPTGDADTGYVASYSKPVTLEDGAGTLIVTNRHTPEREVVPPPTPIEKTEIVAYKQWEGDTVDGTPDYYGLRSDVILHLYGLDENGLIVYDAGTKKITKNLEGDAAKAQWKDVPKTGANGQPLQWRLVEEAMFGYTAKVQYADGNNWVDTPPEDWSNWSRQFLVTNTYAESTTEIEVTKRWEDADDADGKRPTSVTINLLKKVGNGAPEKVAGQTLVLRANDDAAKNWKGKFTDLPVFEAVKTGIEKVTRTEYQDVDIDVYVLNSDAAETDGLAEEIDQAAYDALDADTKAKYTQQTRTIQEPKEIEEKQDVFEEQPVYYLVEEVYDDPDDDKGDLNALGYKKPVVVSTGFGTYEVLNLRDQDTVSVTIRKVWADDDDAAGVRPATIAVRVKDGNTVVATAELSAANSWSATVSGLPAMRDGKTIAYAVEEVTSVLPKGYSSSVINDGQDGTGTFVVTNTYTPEPPIDPVPDEITIVYRDRNNTIVKETIKRGSNEPPQPADPVREGFTFMGWTRTADKDGNVLYEAKWAEGTVKETDTIKVTYRDPSKPEGEQTVLEETIERGTNEPAVPATPTRVGYIFAGWERTDDENGNVTYTAQWEPAPEDKRTVTYVDGQSANPVLSSDGTKPADPDHTSDGLIFLGWKEVADAQGNAIYVANYSAGRMVSYIDGQAESPLLVSERTDDKTSVAAPADPVHDNLEFVGWEETVDPAGNIVYVAKYKASCPAQGCDCEEPEPEPTPTPEPEPEPEPEPSPKPSPAPTPNVRTTPVPTGTSASGVPVKATPKTADDAPYIPVGLVLVASAAAMALSRRRLQEMRMAPASAAAHASSHERRKAGSRQ